MNCNTVNNVILYLADMAYSYNYPQPPPYNTQFPNQTPIYPPAPVFTTNPAPVYAPNQVPYNNPPAPSNSTQQQEQQLLLQQQQQQLLQQQQQSLQQQPLLQQQQVFPNNTQTSYEFDYQPGSAQAYPYPQPHTPDVLIGQMAPNLSGASLAATALQYGPSLAATGKEFFDQKMDTFQQSKSVYKSYWDVDTSYVLRKLLYLLVPVNSGSVQASGGFTSVPTQGDASRPLNSPDLYIPSMSLVTYVLMVGYVLGTQGRFAPDLLGITATSALLWLAVELCCSLLAAYITGMYSPGLWHKLSVLSGYKFFYMVCCIGVFVVFGSFGYYISFLATSISSVIFSVQNLRAIMRDQTFSGNSWYLILAISVLQSPLVYWLTWHLVHYTQ